MGRRRAGRGNVLVLLGVLVVVVGFALRLNAMLVVTVAGLVTGFLGGLSLREILDAFGTGFAVGAPAGRPHGRGRGGQAPRPAARGRLPAHPGLRREHRQRRGVLRRGHLRRRRRRPAHHVVRRHDVPADPAAARRGAVVDPTAVVALLLHGARSLHVDRVVAREVRAAGASVDAGGTRAVER